MKALSVRQPWASFLVLGLKDVENRTWTTNYRGPLLIHASKVFDYDYKKDPDLFMKILSLQVGRDLHGVAREFPRGGVVGLVDLINCVSESNSLWHNKGLHGFVVANPREIPFCPLRGRLGLFSVDAALCPQLPLP